MLPWKIKSGEVLTIEQAGADEWSTQTTARDRPEKMSKTIWNTRCSSTSIKSCNTSVFKMYESTER